jgi:hypothetical protein
VVLTAWLVAMSAWDVRWRALPHWGTTMPLVGLTCWVVADVVTGGRWAVPALHAAWRKADSVALALAFVAVLLSDWWIALVPAVGSLIAAVHGGGGHSQAVVTGWLVALGMAKAGIVGAGDAKLAMVLMALFPEAKMGMCLLGAAGVAGLAVLIGRRGRESVPLLWLTLQDALAGRFPAQTDTAGVVVFPLASALALGALLYLWVLPWMGG